MDFLLNCDCGNATSVADSAAGTSFQCACGRTLWVPSLSELKRQAGLPAYKAPAAQVIEHMLADRELPAATCVECGAATGDTVDAVAECESALTRGTPGFFSSLFVILFLGIWGAVFLLQEELKSQGYGRNPLVRMPITICGSCRRRSVFSPLITVLHVLKLVMLAVGLLVLIFWSHWGVVLLGVGLVTECAERMAKKGRQKEIKQLLRQVSIYRQLLDEFPAARVVKFRFNSGHADAARGTSKTV